MIRLSGKKEVVMCPKAEYGHTRKCLGLEEPFSVEPVKFFKVVGRQIIIANQSFGKSRSGVLFTKLAI